MAQSRFTRRRAPQNKTRPEDKGAAAAERWFNQTMASSKFGGRIPRQGTPPPCKKSERILGAPPSGDPWVPIDGMNVRAFVNFNAESPEPSDSFSGQVLLTPQGPQVWKFDGTVASGGTVHINLFYAPGGHLFECGGSHQALSGWTVDGNLIPIASTPTIPWGFVGPTNTSNSNPGTLQGNFSL